MNKMYSDITETIGNLGIALAFVAAAKEIKLMLRTV